MQRQMQICSFYKVPLKGQKLETVLVGEYTDLRVLSCYHTKCLPYELYLRHKPKATLKRPNTSDIGDGICSNILFLYGILGCDTTSKPYGTGKCISLE